MNLEESKGQAPCPVGSFFDVKTFTVYSCPVTVYYCYTPGAEPIFKILSIYVHPGCNLILDPINLNSIYEYIIKNQTGLNIPPCTASGPVYWTAVFNQSQCYRYERRGYPYYEYFELGGYSIVPCEVYVECVLEYKACTLPSGDKDIVCVNAYTTGYSEITCVADTNNAIVNAFLFNPNLIETVCVSVECVCTNE
jgi:hypothetical protein